jgi:hypothetical protein
MQGYRKDQDYARERETDAIEAELRNREFRLQDEKRRSEEAERKRSLAEDYQRQQEYLHLREAEDRQIRLHEEQRYAEDYASKETRKEQERRQFYQLVQQNQGAKAAQYMQSVNAAQAQRDHQMSQWIANSQESYVRKQAEKEEIERKMRMRAMQETGQTLKAQIEEKERQRTLVKEESRRQHLEEAGQLALANRQWEEQRLVDRKQQQAQYREALAAQERLAGPKASDAKENRSLLRGRGTLQASAAQVLGSQGGDLRAAEKPRLFPDPAADPSWARDLLLDRPQASAASLDANTKAFYGDDSLDKPIRRYVEEPSTHNPISNPIGSRPPVPLGRPLYRAKRSLY